MQSGARDSCKRNRLGSADERLIDNPIPRTTVSRPQSKPLVRPNFILPKPFMALPLVASLTVPVQHLVQIILRVTVIDVQPLANHVPSASLSSDHAYQHHPASATKAKL
mgnify:CR=1 FL=1